MRGTWVSTSWIFFVSVFIMITQVAHCYGQLEVGFYQGKCRDIDPEEVIFNAVKQKIAEEPDTVSDLVRLSFHDCFVRGCDGSIFLDGPNTEQTALVNQGIGGLDTINELKEVIEDACPGLVSCADLLVIGARDAIGLAGGQRYDVETGRRDGFESIDTEAQNTLPPPTMPIPDAIKLFRKKGLSKKDMIILLGGHTVGTAHCHSFKARLYNFHNTSKPDPRISASLLQLLQNTCPLNDPTDNEAFLDQTPNSHFTVDNDYYKQILVGNGTLEIDENLASDPLTRPLVVELSHFNGKFLSKFGRAMVKMARIGVLTGDQGEVRKVCTSVNPKVDTQ